MSTKPTVAPTESLLTFPCEFPLKVLGHTTAEFAPSVLRTIQTHVPSFEASTLTVKPSAKGNYQSVSCTLHAESKAQLDALYQSLCQLPGVVMAL
jgi:putative lipoic acid-binding regulatory protein